MKIVEVVPYAVETPPPHRGGEHWFFVKLTTNDGIVGYGEAYLMGVPLSPSAIVKMIEDIGENYVVGSDPFQVEKLWRRLYHGVYADHPDQVLMGIISGFEIACWDIIGKALDQPIYNLLGGKYHDKLRSYTYIYPKHPGDPVFDDPERFGERALEYVKEGFTALKFDLIRGELAPRQLSLETLQKMEDFVRSMREHVGTRCDILVGTHGQMTTSSAIRLAKRLEKYDPLWFEEPVPPENRDEMAMVARHTSIPIATGERLSTIYEFREVLEKHAASILQMALGRVGGILVAKKIAGMAEAYYAQIAPHLWAGPIEGAANIQIDTCSPNFLIQEGIETWGGFHEEILKEPIKWEKGYIIPPTKPGLGVELNEEVALEHSAVKAHGKKD
ncbi:mandelate racemase/muconate lactonizing enzyme family protein [Candidatus Bathyarchaeota archaeon]|nr:MAG: mandelate racemase/muconate lactonizing enzyme family protein [Candidatus Bathyarchaeota archaeon]